MPVFRGTKGTQMTPSFVNRDAFDPAHLLSTNAKDQAALLHKALAQINHLLVNGETAHSIRPQIKNNLLELTISVRSIGNYVNSIEEVIKSWNLGGNNVGSPSKNPTATALPLHSKKPLTEFSTPPNETQKKKPKEPVEQAEYTARLGKLEILRKNRIGKDAPKPPAPFVASDTYEEPVLTTTGSDEFPLPQVTPQVAYNNTSDFAIGDFIALVNVSPDDFVAEVLQVTTGKHALFIHIHRCRAGKDRSKIANWNEGEQHHAYAPWFTKINRPTDITSALPSPYIGGYFRQKRVDQDSIFRITGLKGEMGLWGTHVSGPSTNGWIPEKSYRFERDQIELLFFFPISDPDREYVPGDIFVHKDHPSLVFQTTTMEGENILGKVLSSGIDAKNIYTIGSIVKIRRTLIQPVPVPLVRLVNHTYKVGDRLTIQSDPLTVFEVTGVLEEKVYAKCIESSQIWVPNKIYLMQTSFTIPKLKASHSYHKGDSFALIHAPSDTFKVVDATDCRIEAVYVKGYFSSYCPGQTYFLHPSITKPVQAIKPRKYTIGEYFLFSQFPKVIVKVTFNQEDDVRGTVLETDPASHYKIGHTYSFVKEAVEYLPHYQEKPAPVTQAKFKSGDYVKLHGIKHMIAQILDPGEHTCRVVIVREDPMKNYVVGQVQKLQTNNLRSTTRPFGIGDKVQYSPTGVTSPVIFKITELLVDMSKIKGMCIESSQSCGFVAGQEYELLKRTLSYAEKPETSVFLVDSTVKFNKSPNCFFRVLETTPNSPSIHLECIEAPMDTPFHKGKDYHLEAQYIETIAGAPKSTTAMLKGCPSVKFRIIVSETPSNRYYCKCVQAPIGSKYELDKTYWMEGHEVCFREEITVGSTVVVDGNDLINFEVIEVNYDGARDTVEVKVRCLNSHAPLAYMEGTTYVFESDRVKALSAVKKKRSRLGSNDTDTKVAKELSRPFAGQLRNHPNVHIVRLDTPVEGHDLHGNSFFCGIVVSSDTPHDFEVGSKAHFSPEEVIWYEVQPKYRYLIGHYFKLNKPVNNGFVVDSLLKDGGLLAKCIRDDSKIHSQDQLCTIKIDNTIPCQLNDIFSKGSVVRLRRDLGSTFVIQSPTSEPGKYSAECKTIGKGEYQIGEVFWIYHSEVEFVPPTKILVCYKEFPETIFEIEGDEIRDGMPAYCLYADERNTQFIAGIFFALKDTQNLVNLSQYKFQFADVVENNLGERFTIDTVSNNRVNCRSLKQNCARTFYFWEVRHIATSIRNKDLVTHVDIPTVRFRVMRMLRNLEAWCVALSSANQVEHGMGYRFPIEKLVSVRSIPNHIKKDDIVSLEGQEGSSFFVVGRALDEPSTCLCRCLHPMPELGFQANVTYRIGQNFLFVKYGKNDKKDIAEGDLVQVGADTYEVLEFLPAHSVRAKNVCSGHSTVFNIEDLRKPDPSKIPVGDI